MTNLTTHEDKLTHFNTFANELINDVHDQEIEGRTREVRSLWDDLMELAGARKEALVGAKKVHSFARHFKPNVTKNFLSFKTVRKQNTMPSLQAKGKQD